MEVHRSCFEIELESFPLVLVQNGLLKSRCINSEAMGLEEWLPFRNEVTDVLDVEVLYAEACFVVEVPEVVLLEVVLVCLV